MYLLKEIDFKKLTPVISEVGTWKICRAGHSPGDPGNDGYCTSSPKAGRLDTQGEPIPKPEGHLLAEIAPAQEEVDGFYSGPIY